MMFPDVKVNSSCLSSKTINEEIENLEKVYLETIRNLKITPMLIERNKNELGKTSLTEQQRVALEDNIKKLLNDGVVNLENKEYLEHFILFLKSI